MSVAPVVDTHLHQWDPATGWYPWLSDTDAVLQREHRIADTAADRTALGVTGAVLVQSADDDRDTDAMLATARADPSVLGVVVYLPLDEPERAASRWQELRADPLVAGVRTLIHDRADPDWLLRSDVSDGLALLENVGLPFDLVAVLPRHLEHVSTLSERFPGLGMVIDHLAKPPIGSDDHGTWRDLMARAAANPRVVAKISGLYPPDGTPTATDLRPWVDTALDLFGPERLMIGSDWPISEPHGGYRLVTGAVLEAVAALGDAALTARVNGANAVSVYGLQVPVR